MQRKLLFLVLLAACRDHHRRAEQPSHAPRVDAGIDLSVPAGPPAYTSFVDVARARRDAEGKAAVLDVRRLVIRAGEVVAEPCVGGTGSLIFFAFTPAQRDLVRGLPFGENTCGKVRIKVSMVTAPGFHSVSTPDGGSRFEADSGTLVEGYALDFPDVTPTPAPTPPAGADFGDVDEIGFAGKEADGKKAQMSGRFWTYLSTTGFFSPCDGRYGDTILDGAVAAAQTKQGRSCHPVRFRVRYSSVYTSKGYTFGGTVLD